MSALALASYPSAMTPDSIESRVARSEERIASNLRQIEMLASLPLQVGVIQERLDSLRHDMHEAERDRNARFERVEAQHEASMERLARSFENQITACSNAIARVAETQASHARDAREWQEAERERREEEAKLAKSSKTQVLVARYGMVGGLAVALIAAIASIVVAFFGGGG